MYRLSPLNGNITLIPLTSKEVKEYTAKTLTDVETTKMDVLNYGRVVDPSTSQLKAGDIVLYQKLASHKTNLGSPRELLVPLTEIEGKLTEVSDDQAA
jgi:hypothetical protein